MHAAGVCGRRDEPVDATAFRGIGVGVRLFPCDAQLSGDPWQAGCLIQRQARRVRVNNKDAVGGDGITQFGRALSELNIDIICANSPQAKGRVERAFGTLQDRLVKELRLAGISTIAAANAWLPGFIAEHNARLPCPGERQGSRGLRMAKRLDEVARPLIPGRQSSRTRVRKSGRRGWHPNSAKRVTTSALRNR